MNVVVIGCGVRGATVAALLAGGGVDELSLVDGGFVEQEDLGRHPLQFTPDLNASKPDALAAKLGLINSGIHAQPFPANLDAANAVAILTGAELVVDCVGDPDVTAAIVDAATELEIAVVTAPDDYSAADATPAVAVAVGALQAASVLAHAG